MITLERSDAKKTIDKFARTYRACKTLLGTDKARAKLRFELVTNRPIEPAPEQFADD